jgi:hypothetical protein
MVYYGLFVRLYIKFVIVSRVQSIRVSQRLVQNEPLFYLCIEVITPHIRV